MGYYITYSVRLVILGNDIERALAIFNHLHTDEMLIHHACGGNPFSKETPINAHHWYSWVDNPDKPYKTLTEAFTNWGLVTNDVIYLTDEETQDFIVSGTYHSKHGQQDFLIEQLAPVLTDTVIHVTGEDGAQFDWVVEDHQYRKVYIKDADPIEISDSEDSADEDNDKDEMK